MKNHPFIQLTISHLKEFFREPGAVFWSFGFPILMAVGLGMAFGGKKEMVHGVAAIHMPAGDSATAASRLPFFYEGRDTVISIHFETPGGGVKYIFHYTGWDDASLLMKRGEINSIITFEEGGPVFNYDPLNPEAELVQIQLSGFFKTGEISQDPGSIRPLTTKGMRYIDFFIPGLLTLGIMMSLMWGVSYSLMEKRAKKLLRRMVATPMRKTHFLMAYWSSRLVLTLFDSIVLLLFAYFFFDIIIQGSLIALILLLLSGNVAFFGLSILLSSRTSNMQVGNGIISFVTTPMMILSGIFFSYSGFPDWAIKFIKVLPLTKFTDEARAIINEGAGLLDVADGIFVLTLFGVICFIAGLKIYKWY